MSGVAATIDRLRRLGVELTPIPPDRIRWRAPAPVPDEARELLDELKARKPEALAILTTAEPQPWDDGWERSRLDAAYSWCDEEARLRGTSWPACYGFSRAFRPNLVAAMDAALDAIDASWKARDVGRHIEACDTLRRAVGAIVDATPLQTVNANPEDV